MYNKVIFVGNLTKDPEVRNTQQGLSVCKFGIAVNTDVSSRQGEEAKRETLFIDIVTFARMAEVCGQYLGKGKMVLVEGRLQERRWETEEGQQRSKMEVIANTVKFLSKKGEKTDDYIPPETTVEDPF
ncbi:MAG TPA: single-stranded DNA-binding protein [Thermodesulfovibrionia bacterium]|nr:single-stranded DNA-binding protein [Thermodesulfovibrionia bacterium]